MRFLSVLLLLFPITGFTQNFDWKSKIDPALWDLAQQPDTKFEFLVIMKEQADVGGARQLRTKAEKGRYVYETLSAFAEQTQRDVRELLQLRHADFQSFWIVNGFWVKGDGMLLMDLAQMAEVGRLESNNVMHLQEPEKSAAVADIPELRNTPRSWGLTQINADDVWAMGYTGAGIVVGGQDTGYEWMHPAIKNKYRGWNGSTVDHNYNWHDAIHSLINGGSNSCGLNLDHPCDDHNHGTHTMGTMVGSVNSDSIYGVAPDATWIGCRNMEEGDGMPSTYIECFQWFIAPTNLSGGGADPNKAPHVINDSWGCPGSEGCNTSNFGTMEGVINNVRAAGIFIAASAGNDGANCSTINSPPAMYDAAYSIGATDGADNIAGFSSRGPVTVYTSIKKPDISAPGVGITSCIGHDNANGSYTYDTWNGTSMAGPHVAGAVALILEARPDLIGDVDNLENLINQSAVPLFTNQGCGGDNAGTRPNNVYGYGRINVLAAVNLALPVELVEFQAKPSGIAVLLQWHTAAESECAYFNIQHSTDGIQWQFIGRVACKGSNSHYTFNDNHPAKGVNYYRMQQEDYSGAVTYSPIRVATVSPSGYTLRLGAQAGKAFFQVTGENAEEQTWLLEIDDLDGRMLQRRAMGYKGILEAPGLPTGLYLIVLRQSNGAVVASEKLFWGL